jgi:outer membrane protein assembly factor BamB
VVGNCVIFGAEQNSDTGGCSLNFLNKTNGGRIWSFHPSNHRAFSTPVVVSDGRVLAGSMDGSLYGFWEGVAVTTPVKVDSTGTTTANLSKGPGSWKLTVFPNPVSGGSVELLFSKAYKGANLMVYDLRGRLIRTMRISNEKMDWDLRDRFGSSVAGGSYVATLRDPSGKSLRTFSLKIVR